MYIGRQAQMSPGLCSCAYMVVPLLTKPSPQSHYVLFENGISAVLSVHASHLACLPATGIAHKFYQT